MKNIHRINFVVLAFIILLGVSCKKDDSAWGPIPELEFVSISPSSLVQYSSPLTITIKYKDGDGDLGENNPDVVNTFITDSRNNLTYNFRTRQLAPDNANIAIMGNLNIEIPSVSLLGDGNSETVTYSIYMTDRAGNKSNTITTSGVTILKQ